MRYNVTNSSQKQTYNQSYLRIGVFMALHRIGSFLARSEGGMEVEVEMFVSDPLRFADGTQQHERPVFYTKDGRLVRKLDGSRYEFDDSGEILTVI
jgi:hypothetical protein